MTIAQCPECGVPLPTNSPQGLCPKCLLQAALRDEDQERGHVETSPSPQAGRVFVPPTVEQLSGRFPQLEILELIGQGGMGAVYKARQRDLDRLVALKILPPEVGSDPAFAERFNREARALAKLSHANIVGVYDSGKEGDFYYLLMEFIDGVNLRQAMQAGSISPEEAVAIVPQICDALQYAHDEGVVHRDIKPENVLVDAKGRVKIADFGLAKLLASGGREPPENAFTLTQSHQVMGTPRYMAPEQMTASHDVDHRADIYSLGVVFYELLTGEVPMGRFDPPSKRVQVDVRLDEIVLRTLDREPDRRYQSASEIKTDMQTLHSRPYSPPPPKPDVLTSVAGEFHSQARSDVKIPGIGLVAVGVLTCVSGLPVVLALLAVTLFLNAPMEEPSSITLLAEETMTVDSVSGDISVSEPVVVPTDEDSHEIDTPDNEVVEESHSAEDWAHGEAAHAYYEDEGVSAPTFSWAIITVAVVVIAGVAIPLLFGMVIALGGWRMMQLKSHGWAVIAAILALLPIHPAWLLGIIFGIWSLIVLNREHVKTAFAESA